MVYSLLYKDILNIAEQVLPSYEMMTLIFNNIMADGSWG